MESITNLIIFSRALGVADESAEDFENCDKILYYFPNDVSLYDQVIKLILLLLL